MIKSKEEERIDMKGGGLVYLDAVVRKNGKVYIVGKIEMD